MGDLKGPYDEAFPAGSTIRIASREALESFVQTWRWHHPLEPTQLSYAGQTATVKSVSFYHGGDELYELHDIPGIWHSQCLERAD